MREVQESTTKTDRLPGGLLANGGNSLQERDFSRVGNYRVSDRVHCPLVPLVYLVIHLPSSQSRCLGEDEKVI